ncbi:MAG: DNA topoisomerase VI subunit B, partial [Desulfurococcales archaeon]|nr:DNA topoisomerase VI subunit B [Desulfurococcales archaeon]
LLRYANKIPLLYDEGADVSRKVLDSINWKLYKIDFPAPLVVLVHVASTKIPYKGVGKESISDVPEIESEIRNAVQDLARRLRVYLGKKHREYEVRRRITSIAKYIPEIALSLAILSKPPNKWQPPANGEEEVFLEKLVDSISRHLEVEKEELVEMIKKVQMD